MTPKPKKTVISSPLRPRITCPHCWKSFAPGDILWVAEHPLLTKGDVPGEGDQQRFLPSRFDTDGHAIDVKGNTCHEVACPACHLQIPRAIVELESVFISTLGAPGSGKSYFLASMIHQTQETALRHFQSNLADVDPVANNVVNDYLNKLFRNSQPGELVNLEKTEEQGRQYTSVYMDQRDRWLPKPFVYSLQPLQLQDDRLRRQLCRAICLYDNAGEHFMPGKSDNQFATQHLALSKVLLFLFDPLQHSRFRQACLGRAEDPQLGKHGKNSPQDQVLQEASRRIKNLTGLAQHAKYSRPLIVVVTKYDVWHSLLSNEIVEMTSLLCRIPDRGAAIDLRRLQKVSQRMRELMFELAPDIVAAAEGFSEEVIYLPNSALGCSPEIVRLADRTEALGVRPCNIRPMLAELPMLYALHRAVPTLIPGIQRTSGDGATILPVEKPVPHASLKPGAKIAREMANAQRQPTNHNAPPPPENAARQVPQVEPAPVPRPKVETYLKE